MAACSSLLQAVIEGRTGGHFVCGKRLHTFSFECVIVF